MRVLATVVLLASGLTTGCTADAPPAPDPTTAVMALVDRVARPLMQRNGISGMAVGVTVHGIRQLLNYGVASRASGAPVTSDTLFEIGSVSKTFTATLATYAQAQGRLSLTAHPSTYLPELRGAAIDKAALSDLGTYTAGGLPLQFPDSVTDDTMLAYFRDFVPTAPPGRERQYSNPSIGLLGHLTALAMKTPFTRLVEADLMPGLGLTNTYIDVPADRMPRYAQGYNRADEPVRVNPGVLGAQAYGIKATVADMVRFTEANIDPSGLTPQLRTAVADTHIGRIAAGKLVQGLGWEQYAKSVSLEQLLAGNSAGMANGPTAAKAVDGVTGPALFNKTGSTDGFGAYVMFVPDEEIGIVMLANRNYPIPQRVTAGYEILDGLRRLS